MATKDSTATTHEELEEQFPGSADVTYFRDNGGITGDFSDPRVILVRPDDERLAIIPNKQITTHQVSAQQTFDGPTYLVIGPSASDDALGRASIRFSVPLPQLQQFRGGVIHG